jgi:hypothetical protein
MNIYTLASKTGLRTYQEQAPGIDGVVGNWEDLEKFAKLVAAHEREECAKIAEIAEPYQAADLIRARSNT